MTEHLAHTRLCERAFVHQLTDPRDRPEAGWQDQLPLQHVDRDLGARALDDQMVTQVHLCEQFLKSSTDLSLFSYDTGDLNLTLLQLPLSEEGENYPNGLTTPFQMFLWPLSLSEIP